ncbi:MAG: hypothetical protein IJX85_08945 [Lachnospiraceae bacterium]|nr:hypothetical protein [Lachnospiraceae bacterium]
MDLYFAVIGNDKRMDYVAQQLYSLGCDVGRDLNKLQTDTVLILPPPVTLESFNIIEPSLEKISCIYAGNVPEEFEKLLPAHVPLYDYLKWDTVIAENAMLTAYGIIREAYHNKAWLKESNVLVTGFGYCGKALAYCLKEQGARVTVAVRNVMLKNEIEDLGYDYIDIKAMSSIDLDIFPYIFNTVPALVIDAAVIDRLNPNAYIYDIASKPGGTNFLYCHEKNIGAVLSLGIPGKMYPEEAGILIANAIYNHISK